MFLVGCGSVSGHPDAPTADAPGSDAPRDAANATCDPAGKFDAPAPLAGFMSAADETSVSLSPDERTVYLSSNDPATTTGAHDVYIAQRASIADPFTGLMPLAAVNSPPAGPGGLEDYDATVSADGKTLILSSNRKPGEGYQPRRHVTGGRLPADALRGLQLERSPEERARGDKRHRVHRDSGERQRALHLGHLDHSFLRSAPTCIYFGACGVQAGPLLGA